MKSTICHRCKQEACNPQKHVTFVDKPYKQTGWVGTTFIPYGSRRSVAKNVKLCGVCFHDEYIEHETIPTLIAELESIKAREIELRANTDIKTIIGRWNRATGRIAHYYPRLRKVSISGGKRMDEQEAIRYMLSKIGEAEPVEATQPPDPTIFEHFSEQSTKAAETLFSCGCTPYVDIFTIGRWNKQGYRVRRGEHGTRIGKATLFCRCQVNEGKPEPVKATHELLTSEHELECEAIAAD